MRPTWFLRLSNYPKCSTFSRTTWSPTMMSTSCSLYWNWQPISSWLNYLRSVMTSSRSRCMSRWGTTSLDFSCVMRNSSSPSSKDTTTKSPPMTGLGSVIMKSKPSLKSIVSSIISLKKKKIKSYRKSKIRKTSSTSSHSTKSSENPPLPGGSNHHLKYFSEILWHYPEWRVKNKMAHTCNRKPENCLHMLVHSTTNPPMMA